MIKCTKRFNYSTGDKVLYFRVGDEIEDKVIAEFSIKNGFGEELKKRGRPPLKKTKDEAD